MKEIGIEQGYIALAAAVLSEAFKDVLNDVGKQANIMPAREFFKNGNYQLYIAFLSGDAETYVKDKHLKLTELV